MHELMRTPPRRLDAVIFDLDGTLWDCTPPVTRAWNRVLAAEGLPRRLTDRDVRGVAGQPMDTLFNTLLPELDAATLQRVAQACMAEEDAELDEDPAPPYAGVGSLLARLQRWHRLFIVSNCQQGYIERFLRTSQLGGLVAGTLCHGDTGMSKADNLRLLRKRHHIGATVYVGDTALDQRSALANNLPFVHAAYGFGRPYLPCLRAKAPLAVEPALGVLQSGG